jgi:hypothetical protein
MADDHWAPTDAFLSALMTKAAAIREAEEMRTAMESEMDCYLTTGF